MIYKESAKKTVMGSRDGKIRAGPERSGHEEGYLATKDLTLTFSENGTLIPIAEFGPSTENYSFELLHIC